MDNKEYEQLVLLAKKHRISFPKPWDESNWPEHIRSMAAKVRSIKSLSYAKYANEDIDSQDKPWRIKTKQQATYLAEVAFDCSRADYTESTWRSKLEPIVFQRFAIEVAW